jgi:hypothetical protein
MIKWLTVTPSATQTLEAPGQCGAVAGRTLKEPVLQGNERFFHEEE